jgi:hypothetical protein
MIGTECPFPEDHGQYRYSLHLALMNAQFIEHMPLSQICIIAHGHTKLVSEAILIINLCVVINP